MPANEGAAIGVVMGVTTQEATLLEAWRQLSAENRRKLQDEWVRLLREQLRG